MKNIKRILAVVLALTMAFGTLASVSAAGTTKWYTEAVNYLEQTGIAKIGTKAETKLTRAEFALWIAKIEAGQKFVDSALWANDGLKDVIVFTDVDESVEGVYRAAINYCYQRKFIRGNGDNTFSPNANVTLAEASAVIVRLMGYEGKVTDKTEWEYNYWNVANTYCHAFDATFVQKTGTVDPRYELSTGEAAYLIATILNWGGKTNTCLTAEGENLGNKFATAVIGASNQLAIVTGLQNVVRTWDGNWQYFIKEWTYNGETYNWGDKTEWIDFTTNVIDETKSTPTLVLIGENGEVVGTEVISYANLFKFVRVSLGLPAARDVKNGEIFNLGDYIANGSVVGVNYDATGAVIGLEVASEAAGTRLVSDTFVVFTSLSSKMKYDFAGNITAYGKYPYLANATGSDDYTPVLPTAYTEDKAVEVNTSKKTITVGETSYKIVSTRTLDADEIVVYSVINGVLAGPLTAAEAKAVMPNTAEGEHCIEFTDIDGDGKYDVAIAREYAKFVYRDKTNADIVNTTTEKIAGVGGVVMDYEVSRITGSVSTDSWTLETSKARNGKIQLLVVPSNQRRALQERYYGNKTTGTTPEHPGGDYAYPYYAAVEIGTLTTGYIKSVEKDPITISGKQYYVTTIVSVADATEKTVYVPVSADDITTRLNVKIEVAGASTTVSVYTGDWMSFVTDYEAAKDIGIAGDGSAAGTDEDSGAWMLDKVVKYAVAGGVAANATGKAADIVCAMLDTTEKDERGFLVSVKPTDAGDNTYDVTVATTGTIAQVDWANVTDIYFTLARKPAWQSLTLNGVYWAGGLGWVSYEKEGDGLNAYEALSRLVGTLDSVADIETTTLADFDNTDSAFVLRVLNRFLTKELGKTEVTADVTLKFAGDTNFAIMDWDSFFANAKAGTPDPKDAGLLNGKETLAAMGITDEAAWAKFVLASKSAGRAWNYTTAAWQNIANALIKVKAADTTVSTSVFTTALATFDTTYGTTLATTYAGAADLNAVAALVAGLDLADLAAKINAGDWAAKYTAKLYNMAAFVESIVHSGFYSTSKFIWNKGTCQAPDYGWFTALVTAKGATNVKTYTVRASASSIWDYDNYAIYNNIFKGYVVTEHTGSDAKKLSGYDLIYVQIMKDGSSYVLQYLGEDSAVYVNNHAASWLTHYGATGTLYTADNNSTFGDAWDCKGEFAYQSASDTAEVLTWKKYASEVIIDGVDLSDKKYNTPGTYTETITIGINPYYLKTTDTKGALKGYDRYYFEEVATYSNVIVNVEAVAGDSIVTYIPVVDGEGNQIVVSTDADKKAWESTNFDAQGVAVQYKVIDSLLYKVNTARPQYKYDANGNVVVKKTVDYSQKVLVGTVAYDKQVDEVPGLVDIVPMTTQDAGFFPGAYAVTFDGRTYVAAENTKVVVMYPEVKTGNLTGKTYTIKSLYDSSAELFVTDYQIAANGTSLTLLSVIGEIVVEKEPVAPVVDTSTLVYLSKDGVTVEAVETGKYFVVRSTYSASVIPTCEDFGSIYNAYDTYAEAKYYQDTVKLGIATGYYRVNDDGSIKSVASEVKHGVIKATDLNATASFKATLDGKAVTTTGYKWAFLYTDFDGNLNIAGTSTSVAPKSTADIESTLKSAKDALATAEANYASTVELNLSDAIQADYLAKVEAAETALATAQENAIKMYLNGQFWGVVNSPAYNYVVSNKYTYQKDAADITFDYIYIDGTYCVFVNSFFG